MAMKTGSTQMSKRRPLYGVGINDLNESVGLGDWYRCWKDMLKRCYSSKYQEKYPTYKGCTVCKEWLSSSSFKPWFDENYVAGFVLDKDLLSVETKEYSPNTCCFIPQSLNIFLIKRVDKVSIVYPGVYQHNVTGLFVARFGAGVGSSLGYYTTAEEAFLAHLFKRKVVCEGYIREYQNRPEMVKGLQKQLRRILETTT